MMISSDFSLMSVLTFHSSSYTCLCSMTLVLSMIALSTSSQGHHLDDNLPAQLKYNESRMRLSYQSRFFSPFAKLLLIVTFVSLLSVGEGAVFRGTVVDSSKSHEFVYLGKFCFDYTTGPNHHKPGGLLEVDLTPLDTPESSTSSSSPSPQGAKLTTLSTSPTSSSSSPSSTHQPGTVTGAEGLQLWIFDDEAQSWPSLKFEGVACRDRMKYARGVFDIDFKKDQQGIVCRHTKLSH